MAYSEARKKATAKYKDQHYKRVPLDVPIEFFEMLKAEAAARGESVNGFIKRAVTERVEREGAVRPSAGGEDAK